MIDLELDADSIVADIMRAMPETADNIEVLKPDKARAAEYREQLNALMAPVCALMDEARRSGLVINFGVAADPYGRMTVQNLTIVRPL